jgi:nucleotide-binding universal stress UspA family protein
MDVKTILWPTDLSENSLHAAESVKYLSGKLGAEVLLLYVGFNLDNYFPAYGEGSDENHMKFEAWELQEAAKRLDRVCGEKLDGCPIMDKVITTGDPAQKILDTIDKMNVDMVAMSTSGRGGGGDRSGLCGGVTEKIVRTAPVHVLTVNPHMK